VSARLHAPLVAALVALLVGGAGGATAARLLTGKSVKDESLSGRDIKDGSLGKREFAKGVLPTSVQVPIAGGQGPAGPAGSSGTPGTSGAPGANGSNAFGRLTYRKAGPFDNDAGTLRSGAAQCPDGERAIGGGGWGDAENAGQTITASAPASSGGTVDPSRWQVWMSNTSNEDATFDVYVICAAAAEVSTR